MWQSKGNVPQGTQIPRIPSQQVCQHRKPRCKINLLIQSTYSQEISFSLTILFMYRVVKDFTHKCNTDKYPSRCFEWGFCKFIQYVTHLRALQVKVTLTSQLQSCVFFIMLSDSICNSVGTYLYLALWKLLMERWVVNQTLPFVCQAWGHYTVTVNTDWHTLGCKDY